ncbi:hypothetical protein ACHAXH_003883 [Discostella pseudostelligera]
MSFQDVGKPGTRRAPGNAGGAGAFSSAAAAAGRGMGSRGGASGPPNNNTSAAVGGSGGGSGAINLSGYEQVSDAIVQYQRNVALLEKMARNAGKPNDTSILQTQYNLQVDVLHQLSHRIEDQLRSHETRLASLPRNEASTLRTTHIKLNRDYRSVEQQFKNLCLDVKRKRSMAEVMQRESARIDDENRGKSQGGEGSSAEESGMRWQMQIQEDKINEEIMREREEEIKNIHRGMHQVNEIYKDLAHLVDGQQEGIDQIETQMENSKENTATGLRHIEKANESASQTQCIIS